DQVHQSQILAYRPGVDANDAREAFIARLDGPVPGLPSPQTIGSTGIYSAGLGSTFILDEPIQSGRTYAFACYVQDREGGPPHVNAYDMYAFVMVE
ncbi:MAG TPA: hypothetical protein VFK59_07745, partial [Actinomycetota bacterium]|nr:hypothetical protein [Actinomycetota bacterium]